MRLACKFTLCFINLFLFFSCDDFSESHLFFNSDKAKYMAGDSIFLTINIVPEKGTKRIKVYENLKNIRIGSNFIVERKLDNGVLSEIGYSKGIIENRSTDKQATNLTEHTITPESPYKKTIKGVVHEDEINFQIRFPIYGLTIIIEKEAYNKAKSFGFIGYSDPINAPIGYSYEDYFEFYPIKLISKLDKIQD